MANRIEMLCATCRTVIRSLDEYGRCPICKSYDVRCKEKYYQALERYNRDQEAAKAAHEARMKKIYGK